MNENTAPAGESSDSEVALHAKACFPGYRLSCAAAWDAQNYAWVIIAAERDRAKRQAAQEPTGRSEQEIVDQTEDLAKFLLSWRWGQEPESPATTMRNTINTKGSACWQVACHIQELLTGTDVENAVAEVDAAAPQPAISKIPETPVIEQQAGQEPGEVPGSTCGITADGGYECECGQCGLTEAPQLAPAPVPPTEQQARDMGAKGAPPTEAERLLFEAWMRGHCWRVVGAWDGCQYVHEQEASGNLHAGAMGTRRLWAAWRDRAALAQAVQS